MSRLVVSAALAGLAFVVARGIRQPHPRRRGAAPRRRHARSRSTTYFADAGAAVGYASRDRHRSSGSAWPLFAAGIVARLRRRRRRTGSSPGPSSAWAARSCRTRSSRASSPARSCSAPADLSADVRLARVAAAQRPVHCSNGTSLATDPARRSRWPGSVPASIRRGTAPSASSPRPRWRSRRSLTPIHESTASRWPCSVWPAS